MCLQHFKKGAVGKKIFCENDTLGWANFLTKGFQNIRFLDINYKNLIFAGPNLPKSVPFA